MIGSKQNSANTLHPGRVVYLPLAAIRPNPAQPRRIFDPAGLQELAASIRQYGILQPLSVRRRDGGYELVAGERRLRAAGLAGLRDVPCLIIAASDQDAGMLALVENLQRRDLDYLEQAEGLARLMQEYHLTQTEAAQKLGKSQSAIANKLRLLRLSPQVLELLRAGHLSERHARALLRLPDEAMQLAVLRQILAHEWTVARTESHIDALLAPAARKRQLGHFTLRDMRVFFNSLNHQLSLIRAAGIDAGAQQQETEREIILTIRIPKYTSSS